MRIVREWKKLYGEDRCKGLTSESALFVCNKWDDVERLTKTFHVVPLVAHEQSRLRSEALTSVFSVEFFPFPHNTHELKKIK